MASSNSSTSSQKATSGNNSGPTVDIGNPYTPRRPTPIVSISINHPIGTALRKIKNFLTHKQTLFSTTFNIKITPIVALVSVLGVAAVFGGGITTAFTFGKTVEQKFLASSFPTPTTQPTPPVTVVSFAGVIKTTTELPPTTTSLNPTTTIIPSITLPDSGQARMTDEEIASSSPTGESSPRNDALPTLTPTPTQILHYILLSRNVTFLSASSTVQLQKYLNLRVIITGTLNPQTNTLTVTRPQDIEVLQ